MKKLSSLILLFLFIMASYPLDVSAHVKKHAIKHSAQKKISSKKNDEKQLRTFLVKKLSRTFPKNELEIIFSDQRLFLDWSVFQAEKSSCPRGYFDPNCGILIPESLKRGKEFMEKHREIFDAVYKEYGVRAEIIAAVLRVETNFGSHLGKRSVLNTLYTRYALMPSRRNTTLKQMEFFLRLAKANRWDLFEIKGSSWGAIGLPQFMPFSYWYFAVDGDKDGKTNLFDTADAIYSIANYLNEHGWSDKPRDQRAAIWAYNHDRIYVKAVMEYARALIIKIPSVTGLMGFLN